MRIEDRHRSIASWVAENGTISVEQVVEKFSVSPATARRDLDALAHQMVVIRTRGGARAAPISGDLPLRYRAALMSNEKLAIARAAVAMIKPGQTVAFTGGTTTTQIAQELGVRASVDPEFSEKQTTVVTNAINIANDLIVRPELRVVLTGGAAIARSYELVGPLAKAALPLINVDLFFIGVNAIDSRRGFFTEFEAEAEISAAILETSLASYIVADHTKFKSSAFALICAPAAVDGLITDSSADPESVAALEAAGCPVITG